MGAPYTLICICVNKTTLLLDFMGILVCKYPKQENFNALGSLKFNVTFKLVLTSIVV
jgi:hypothetical protein